MNNEERNQIFDKYLSEIQREIEKRRSKWVLSTLDFEDVSQELMTRIFLKFHLFNIEKGPFQNWVNTVISNGIQNILRDNLTKFSRPCILGCTYNLGGEDCGYTKSGKQCIECPLYERWKQKKEQHFNVKASLSLENHEYEAQNMIHEFTDIEHCKEVIDEKIKNKLNEEQYKIYKLLYIDNKTMEEAGKILKYKKSSNSKIPGYQNLLHNKKLIIKVVKEIINEEGLV